MAIIDGVCRFAADHPILALLVSVVLLLWMLGIAYAWRVWMDPASW